MSAILDALVKLEESIGKLEGAATHVEASLAGQQRDMFGAPAQKAANGNGIDKAAVAQKLNNIIEHAETVLKESA